MTRRSWTSKIPAPEELPKPVIWLIASGLITLYALVCLVLYIPGFIYFFVSILRSEPLRYRILGSFIWPILPIQALRGPS